MPPSRALDLARRNAATNGLANISFESADVFRHLADLVAVRRQFDVVVLDPPKFARNRAAVPEALKGYRRLHQLALKLLAKDGVLVSCCCTGLIALAGPGRRDRAGRGGGEARPANPGAPRARRPTTRSRSPAANRAT